MEQLRKIGGVLKKYGSRLFSAGIISIVSVVLFVVIGAGYITPVKDAIFNPKNSRNAPYAINDYSSNIDIDDAGNIESKLSAQELWDKMKKENNTALKYLNSPEQLKKLMNVELITKYLDTRSNPDAPIDWSADKLSDVNSKDIQGIIKLKRADSDGKTSTLSYIDPGTFQSYIDEYNDTGSEDAKNNAMKHFTLDAITIDLSTGQAATITKGESIQIPSGLGKYFTYMGWQKITSTTSTQYHLREVAGMNFNEEGFGIINGRYVIACTTTFGNVGDYVDFYQSDGNVLPCIIGDIKNQNDKKCTQWGHEGGQCVVEFVVNKDTWYSNGSGSHANPGTSSCHPELGGKTMVKAVNGGSYFDDPTFGVDNIEGNGGTVSNGEESNDNTAGDEQQNEENNNSNSTKTTYYAKVATWGEQTTTITSNDPDVPGMQETSYNMTTTNINYQEMVQSFKMPFEYLWTYLVLGKDIDLTMELADLVYNSEIEITVFDNLEVDTNILNDTYTKKTKVDTAASVMITYGDDAPRFGTVKSDNWTQELSNNYTVTTTIITKTNTLDAGVTKANVWLENYTREYKQQVENTNADPIVKDIEDIDYPSNPNYTTDTDDYGYQSKLIESAKKEYEKKYKIVYGSPYSVKNSIYNSTVDRTQTTTNNVSKTTYVGSPASIEEKTDKNSQEPNFVSIFCKVEYRFARERVFNDVDSWLFKILSSNDSTKDMVDLTKYFINKIIGKDIYKDFKTYDFSEYNPSEFSNVGISTGGTTGGTGSEIIEIAKEKQGCPYAMGAKGPDSFDCSGFVYWVYKQVGINVPGSTDAYMALKGTAKEIDWSEAQPGDILIVFASERGTKYGHAGIYLGDNKYIHAPQTGDVVKISSGAKSSFKHVFRLYTDTSSASGTAVEGDGYTNEIKLNNKTYKEYKQSRGSYTNTEFGVTKCSTHNLPHIHNNGCGPTSVAIIASGYGKNYSPGDIAKLMGGAGVQSSGDTISKVLNKIGISSHAEYSLTKDKLRKQLKTGKPFVVSVNNGLGNLFTPNGHLMAILAIKDNDEVYVSNPNPSTAHGWIALDKLYECAKSKYAIFVDQK